MVLVIVVISIGFVGAWRVFGMFTQTSLQTQLQLQATEIANHLLESIYHDQLLMREKCDTQAKPCLTIGADPVAVSVIYRALDLFAENDRFKIAITTKHISKPLYPNFTTVFELSLSHPDLPTFTIAGFRK